jgi:hypothetical protein
MGVSGFSSFDAYETFSAAVSRGRRFIHQEAEKGFLAALLETASARETAIPAGTGFWRAQIGSFEWTMTDGEEGDTVLEEGPLPFSRMKPPLGNPTEGRLNPRGIPVLYLATKQETAIAESRPWVGARVTVATFQTQRPLRVIDCQRSSAKLGRWNLLFMLPGGSKLTQEQTNEAVWADIDRAFARPVEPGDSGYLSYVPTQVIAEVFADAGFDGVAYGSALGKEGVNVALFDLSAAEVTTTQLHLIDGFQIAYSAIGNTWYQRDGQAVTNVITDILPVTPNDPNIPGPNTLNLRPPTQAGD